ncbi:MAG: hypothetical protein EOM80_19705, partial [Erysipelotrichia bacterium]|nr:hypothetical protein [Erysipelotrichia bacterium]
DFIMPKSGRPFANQKAAKGYQAKNNLKDTHDITPVRGGFVLMKKPSVQRPTRISVEKPVGSGAGVIIPNQPRAKMRISGMGDASRIEKRLARNVTPALQETAKIDTDKPVEISETSNIGKPANVTVTKSPDVANRKHSFSNTDITVPNAVSSKMLDLGKSIPDSELYIDKDDPSYGRETRAHVTVRYGLDTDNPADLKRLSEMPPIRVKMGDVSIFEADKYDVVKVDVDSPELRTANQMVGELVAVPGETHKDYKPHATIAYVKKGEGKKYVGNKTLFGKTFEIDEINLVDRDGKEHKIKLTGKPTDQATIKQPEPVTEPKAPESQTKATEPVKQPVTK